VPFRKRISLKKTAPVFLAALLLLIVGAFPSYSAKSVALGTVSGDVVDAGTGEAVIAAIVILHPLGKSTTTDTSGSFFFDSVPSGNIRVVVRAPDYDSRVFHNIRVGSGKNRPLHLEIQIATIRRLPTMLVTASRIILKKAFQTTSVLHLAPGDIKDAPGAIEDVNRIIQSQPSAVSSTDLEDNSFYVRGGSDRENTFLLDGIEVNNISHWGSEYGSGGSITMINPEVIKSMDYYAGGFPVKFPPRLSSVIDITFRDGATDERKYLIDANVAGLGVFLEGPFAGKKGNYIIDGRVSFLNLVRPFLGVSGIPQYQDGQLRLAYNFTPGSQLVMNVIGGSEDYREDSDPAIEQGWYKTQAGRHAMGGLTWRTRSDLFSNEAVVSGVYQHYDEDWDNDSSFVFSSVGNERSRFQAKDNLTLFFRENDQLSLGAVVERENFNDHNLRDLQYLTADLHGDSSYSWTATRPDPTQPLSPSLLYIDTLIHDDTAVGGYRVGGHAGYAMKLGLATADLGMRTDYFTMVHKAGISPRAGLRIELAEGGEEAGVSAGMEYQYPSYAEAYIITEHNTAVALQRSYDAVLSFQKQITEDVIAAMETYYKYGDREPFYAIVDNNRQMMTDFARYGKKKTYGIEVSLQKKHHDWFYYQLGYTYFDSRLQYQDGNWYDADLNLHNAGTAIVGSALNKYHSISLRLDMSEGAPYTPVDVVASKQRYYTVYDVSKGWNAQRREPRVELGIRYDLSLYLKRCTVTAYVEVQNLLGRRYIISEELRQGRKYGDGYIYQYKSRGIFPVGGLMVDF
jgi:hypothetical protein